MIWALIVALPALALASSTGSWRAGILRGWVAVGCFLAASTELLSALRLLEAGWVFLLWCLVFLAAVAALIRTPLPRISFRTDPVIWCAALGAASILATTLTTALLSAPNSADAMAYHLPRVVFWAQQKSVAFYPAHYLNQVMLQPLAEYLMLHSWLLSGSDRWANLGQWLGSLVSVVGVSAIAALFGGTGRGQALAALFCATIPNGVLQATGAKNDFVLTSFLVCFVYFGFQWKRRARASDAAFAAGALSLALLTKATAYLFIPPLAAWILLPALRGQGVKSSLRFAAFCTAAVIAGNGPHYLRNIEFSGSPLGYDSAFGDPSYRWRNDRFGLDVTLSNALRNLSEQLGSPSEQWNMTVFRSVMWLHRKMGWDADDPSTTWRGSRYEPPRSVNHEANAPNLVHLAVVLFSLSLLALPPAGRNLLWYSLALAAGFIFFCAYLRFQPNLSRMFLPLFVLASPVAGLAAERLRFSFFQFLLCLLLLNTARLPALGNSIRPLTGPSSILRATRWSEYLADLRQFGVGEELLEAARAVSQSGCRVVGIDSGVLQVEYPVQAVILDAAPATRFVHVGVDNPSARYATPGTEPCAVVCLGCAGNAEKISLHSRPGLVARQFGGTVILLPTSPQ